MQFGLVSLRVARKDKKRTNALYETHGPKGCPVGVLLSVLLQLLLYEICNAVGHRLSYITAYSIRSIEL